VNVIPVPLPLEYGKELGMRIGPLQKRSKDRRSPQVACHRPIVPARKKPQAADSSFASPRAPGQQGEYVFIPNRAMAVFLDAAADELYQPHRLRMLLMHN
jgi:hypothetical protein